MSPETKDSDRTEELLGLARAGHSAGIERLLALHRERLRRLVEIRIDDRLRRRIDASDVVQEALLEASQRLPEYLERRPMQFFVWLRFLTKQRLAALHRHHVGAQARDPAREVPIDRRQLPAATSQALAAQLLGQLTSPTRAAIRAETRQRLREALDALEPAEREILALRHFEQLTNAEAALELEVLPKTASKRYVRALARLRGILASMHVDVSVLEGAR